MRFANGQLLQFRKKHHSMMEQWISGDISVDDVLDLVVHAANINK